ncbi:MAG: hypothetical protein S0880_24555 [Actinomycetota bacterium]|nr:hypothetical protein [Actinomycetota bacterium]
MSVVSLAAVTATVAAVGTLVGDPADVGTAGSAVEVVARADERVSTATTSAARSVVSRPAAGGAGPVLIEQVTENLGCIVVPLVPADGYDEFYDQYCTSRLGVRIVADEAVDPDALVAAAELVDVVLADRPDIVTRLVDGDLRIGVLDRDDDAPEMPEYRDLPRLFPDVDWTAARAYGARPGRPLMVVPEENLLCRDDDTYPGQSVFLHEIGHTVLDMAVIPADPTFEDRVEAAYEAAMASGVYVDSYATVNADEYWAEGVQDYFDASRPRDESRSGGFDSRVADRRSLLELDPTLHALVAEVFGDNGWRFACP